MKKIKFKKLREDVNLPEYKTSGASGFDFESAEDVCIRPGETKIVPTGLAIELPEPDGFFSYELQVRARSGTSLKTDIRIANGVGTVDFDYKLEIGIIVWNKGDDYIYIEKGDRIAQGIICPVIRCEIEETENLSETERIGGFGSTGVN